MFDEWYAQSSFAEGVQSASPQKPALTRERMRTETVETKQLDDEKNASYKAATSAFEKPVIVRPKSTSDFRGLHRIDNKQYEVETAKQLELRVEQDLEAKPTKWGLQDDKGFEVWSDSLHARLESATLEKTYRAVLQARLHSCNTILSRTSSLLSTLNNLKLGFSAVADQTSSFESQCDALVKEEEQLSRYADKLAENLQPFESLEPISRLLNTPGADLVTKSDFISSLKRIDQGLSFFKENVLFFVMKLNTKADFKDAELYEMRFRQCMTRALTLIRVYFVNALKSIAADINERISAKAMNETTQSALLYAKFRSNSAPLKSVVREIEKRSYGHEEYASLLNECYQAYFSIRIRLITPIIMSRMAEISGNKDILSYCRSAFSFLQGVCYDEYELFYQFFPIGEKELYRYLADLSEPLYEHVRPRIIHEAHIVPLSELCLLFQTQFMRDPDEVETSFFETPQLDFGVIVQPALKDAQSRLVFRTENLIVNEIQNFVPKDRDLNYPQLLHVISAAAPPMSPLSPGLKSPNILSPIGKTEFFDSGVLFKGWYPTLRKSVWILSKIYRLVNSAVFDDLAHQVVHLCIHSLFNASTLLLPKTSRLDADLFLIKHLLILKEQIGAFDIEFVRPETEIDFSRVVNRFIDLSSGAIFSRAGLRKVASIPVVVENMLDAKEELDGKLRIAINGFTATAAEGISSAVVGKAEVDANEEEIRLAAANFRETSEKVLPIIQQKTEEYIGDPRTTDILVNAVMENALTGYEKFYNEVEKNHGKLAGEIWDVHTLATWLNGLVTSKDRKRNNDDDDAESNAGSEGRLERDFDIS